ncbi:MAG: hypothetical protein HGA80_04300 [Candidatus Omnitrophica bacterium]|nr:hypothetical protein [Candidatus Omnitrophota bacterium]
MAAGDAKRALGDLARRALLFVVLGGSSSCAVPSKTPEPASLEALQPVSGDTPEQLSNKLDKLKIELNGAQSAYDKILKDEQDNQRMIDQKMELKRASARSLEISRNKTASEAQLQQIQLQIRSIEKLLESSGGEKGLGQKTEGQGSDKAMNGGIDLNAKNMGLDVAKDGKGIEMKFDPAMVAEFQKGNFAGVEGIILRIVPIQSPLPILGLETSRTEGALAKG